MSRKTFKCPECGERTDWESGYYVEGLGDVCEQCYYDTTLACVLCGERFGECVKSEFVLFKWELHEPAGIYFVLAYPFLLCPLIGSQSVLDWDVLFVDRLTKRDAEYEMSGTLCQACAKPCHRTLLEAYGGSVRWLKKNQMDLTRVLQANRIESVIKRHPEMMLDAEWDPEDPEWLEFKERYRLPDLKTYRERLFIEYKGIKVYSIYEGSDSWLTLSPLPRHRSTYSGPVFDVTSLPTWRRAVGQEVYDYRSNRQHREALIMAIDKGLITERGIKR